MEKPIIDPEIPYIGPICNGRFTPGKLVRIIGTPPGIAYRFDINLQCGPQTTPHDDIALQVSVRILDGCIVTNSLQNGLWDEEKRGERMPIKRAEKFELIIVCDFNKYKIIINGQDYCEFPQKIHYDRISHLSIGGDVSIIQISYESSSGDTSVLTPIHKSSQPMQNDLDDFEIMNYSKPPPYSMVHNISPPYPLNAPTEMTSILPQMPTTPSSPPIGSPILVNTVTTTRHIFWRQCSRYFWSITIGIVIILAAVAGFVLKYK